MPVIKVDLGEELFTFTSEQHWINKARSWFGSLDMKPRDYICIDSDGRVCQKGLEFMRATKENTYPITVYKTLCD